METVVRKWGDSLGMRIPSIIAKNCNLTSGSTVEIHEENGAIILVPQRQELGKLLSRITPENLHKPIDAGPTVGAEEW